MSFVWPDGSAFRKVSAAGEREETQRTHISSNAAGTLLPNLVHYLFSAQRSHLEFLPRIGTLNGSFSTLVRRRERRMRLFWRLALQKTSLPLLPRLSVLTECCYRRLNFFQSPFIRRLLMDERTFVGVFVDDSSYNRNPSISKLT